MVTWNAAIGLMAVKDTSCWGAPTVSTGPTTADDGTNDVACSPGPGKIGYKVSFTVSATSSDHSADIWRSTQASPSSWSFVERVSLSSSTTHTEHYVVNMYERNESGGSTFYRTHRLRIVHNDTSEGTGDYCSEDTEGATHTMTGDGCFE